MSDGLARLPHDEGVATVTFDVPADESGVSVIDPIERRRYVLSTPSEVHPTPTDPADLAVPVDSAVTIETDELRLRSSVMTVVRNASGEMLTYVEFGSERRFAAGTYYVDICAPIKLYLLLDGPFAVSVHRSGVVISLDERSPVIIGGRSYHERPTGSLTVPDDPTAAMTALSHLSSALKTTSPERSFPTLRGHPPTIERGDELTIPDGIEPADTGVAIEIPPEYEYVYPTASLAYYLGADVRSGSSPRLVTDTGFEYSLSEANGSDYERAIERVLKGTVLLDCIVRTEGFYHLDLYERRQLEPTLPFDPADAYDWSLMDRLEAYLSVPYASLEPHVPKWPLTAYVPPTPRGIELLPFAVNDLALVKLPTEESSTPSDTQQTDVEWFMRGDEFVRSPADSTAIVTTPSDDSDQSGSIEEAWVGEDIPLGASKMTASAFRNRLDRPLSSDAISIAVVCNDDRMIEEYDAVSETYGDRDSLAFDIRSHERLDRSELAAVLEADHEFVHYIGHIDDDGFRCADGTLDAASLDHVGTDAFLLNACRSYEQGMELLERGSISGVVTLENVIDRNAIEVGCTIAQLLNRGFSLRGALDVMVRANEMLGEYILVGDGSMTLVQPESGVAKSNIVEPVGDCYEVTFRAHFGHIEGVGSAFNVHTDVSDCSYLVPGDSEPLVLDATELEAVLSLSEDPVIYQGEFSWSSEFIASEL